MRITEEQVWRDLEATEAKPALCIVPGCDRPRYSRQGYCNAHRYRARVGAPMDTPLRIASYEDAVCAVEGCERRPMARNLCAKHYQRWRCDAR